MLDDRDPVTQEEADAALTDPAVEPEPAAEPAAEPEGQPRDEQGRFTAEPPSPEPEPAAAEAAPEVETPPEPTEAPPEAEAESYPGFTYRADNQDFEIPGSAVGEDGVFIPQDQLPELQNLLSAGRASFGSVRQRLSDAASREQQAIDRATAAEAKADHLLAQFDALVEQSQNATTLEELANSPLGQWLLGVKQNWAILKAEARAKAVEMQGQQATKELERYRKEEQRARMRPLMDETLRTSVWQQGREAGLDDQTIQAIHDRLKSPQYQSYLFVEAPYDDPAAGFRKGEQVIDHGVVHSAIELATINRPQMQKIAQAQAANARAAPAKKIPPTVGAKGRAPTAGGIPKFKSREEVDKWFVDGGYADLDVEQP